MTDIMGYPTDAELDAILNYKGDVDGMIEIIRRTWRLGNDYVRIRGKTILKVELHTFGWSGNEAVIATLKDTMFWTIGWERTCRGGHYYFRFNRCQLSNFKLFGSVRRASVCTA